MEGFAQTKRVVRTVLLLCVALAAFRLVPVYVNALRFKIAVYEAARDGATMRSSVDAIRGRILWQAQSLGVPVKDEDVVVEVDSSSRMVTARTRHAVVVGMIVTTLDLKFHN